MFVKKKRGRCCCWVVVLLLLLQATTTTTATAATTTTTFGMAHHQGPQQQQRYDCEDVVDSMQVLEDFHSRALSFSTEAVKDSLRVMFQFVSHNCKTTNTTNNQQQEEEDGDEERQKTTIMTDSSDVEEFEAQDDILQKNQQQQRRSHGGSVSGKTFQQRADPFEDNEGGGENRFVAKEERYKIPYLMSKSKSEKDAAIPKQSGWEVRRSGRERRDARNDLCNSTVTCLLGEDRVVCSRNTNNPTQLTLSIESTDVTVIANTMRSASANELRLLAPTVTFLVVDFTSAFPSPNILIPNELWTEVEWESVTGLTIRGENGRVEFPSIHNLPQLNTLRIDINNPLLSDSSLQPFAQQLTELWIKDANSLTSLPPGLFHNMNQLDFLGINAASLTSIHPDAFLGLAELQEIDVFSTAISSLPSNLFRDQTSLGWLSLRKNQLTSLPPGIFSTLTSLTGLDLDGNQLTSISPNVFPINSSVNFLDLVRNKLTSVPPDLLQPLPLLRELLLSDNQLTTLPPTLFSHTSNLRFLNFHNNQLQLDEETSEELWSSLTQLIDLVINDNTQLQLNADHFGFKSTLQILHAKNIKLFIPPINTSPNDGIMFPQLNNLELDGTPFSIDRREDLIAFFGGLRNLQQFAIGYENGFHELSQQMFGDGGDFLCENSLLRSGFVTYLKISHSSFTNIALCTDRINSIDYLDLSDNPDLQRVELNVVGTMQVRNSISLNDIGASIVHLLDVSNTNFPYTTQLCRTLGTDQLYARNMRHPSFQQQSTQMKQLLQNCVERVDVFDISNTLAFRDPSFVTNVLSQPITIRSDSNTRGSGIECHPSFVGRVVPPSRHSVPSLIINGHNYICTLISISINQRQFAEPQFSFECGCVGGFNNRNGQCVNLQLSREQVVGIAAGVFLLTLVFSPLLAYCYLRTLEKRRLRKQRDLERNLLVERQAMDLEVLTQAWEIDVSELRKIRKLDEGAFGEVWTCEWGTITVAVKYLKYTAHELGDLAQDCIKDFRKEADFLLRTRNPYVVRFFGTGTDQWGSPFIVLEFISLGSLRRLLDKGLANVISEYHNNEVKSQRNLHDATTSSSTIDEGEWCDESGYDTHDINGFDAVLVGVIRTPRQLRHKLMRDVALGMDFLHKHNILHRDLKAGNVLVSKRLQAKLTDFGSISRHLRGVHEDDDEQQHDMSKLKKLNYSKAIGMMSLSATSEDAVGTPLYMAPEVLLGRKAQKHSEKSDVFSYGMLLWEVATEQRPDLVEQEVPGYSGPLLLQLNTLLNQGHRLRFPDNLQSDSATCVDEWYKKLYGECVSLEPESRPSFKDILLFYGWGKV